MSPAGRAVLDPWRGDRLTLEQAGGKGLALQALRDAGEDVPRFVVVPVAAFEAHAGGGEPPRAFTEALAAGLALAGLDAGYLAVRSSAQAEDGAGSSWAGQFESVLGVRAAEVLPALRRVWESARSARVEAYRASIGAPAPRLAVLVQALVEAEVSGVAFTADPVSRRGDVVVLSAVLGLGEGLVSGELDADVHRVQAGGVETRIALKPRACRRASGGGTVYVPVDAGAEALPALAEAEVLGLAARFRRLERALGGPQDIEWALGPGRRLFLLQSRPITTLKGELRIWDNSNIVESYSGVTLPLTFSFARGVYEEAYIVFSRLLGVPQSLIDRHRGLFSRRLAHVQGRVYYNLVTWYGNLALLPFYGSNRAFMERMMGVSEPLPDGLVRPPAEGTLAASWRALRTGFGLAWAWWRNGAAVRDFHARVERSLAPLEAEDLRRWDADRLAAAFAGLERDVLRHWKAPLVNDLFAMVSFGLLSRTLARWRADLPEGAVNDLLSGEGGIISTRPLEALAGLAALALAEPGLADLFDSEQDDRRIQARLESFPRFHAAAAEYLRLYGARCAGELKLETLILRDEPEALLGLVRGQLGRLRAGLPPPRDEAALRKAAEARVFAGLGPWRSFCVRGLLSQARSSIRHRENQRFERTRAFAVVRRIFQGIGRRFAEAGLLDGPADIFYLSKDEVFGALDGTSSSGDLRGLAALRRREFDGYAAAPAPPDRFSTWGPLALAQVSARPVILARDGLQGLGCCPGVVRAQARVVADPRGAGDLQGRILVAERTDPGWTLIFPGCAGIVVERGSLLSHSAIVARELGLPCVVAVGGLLASVRDGDWIEIDGSAGTVRRVGLP